MVGVADATQQIVYYSDEVQDPLLKVPNMVLLDHPGGVTLHSDLLDCHVDICSPEVLWRFSENFDYLEVCRNGRGFTRSSLFFASSCPSFSFFLQLLPPFAAKLRRGFVASEVANLDLGQYIFAEILDDPSPRFVGGRPGWMFKNGHLGMGYYRDAPMDVVLPKKA